MAGLQVRRMQSRLSLKFLTSGASTLLVRRRLMSSSTRRPVTPTDITRESAPIIKYRCPNGRIFARVFREDSIEDCEAVIRNKLGLPPETNLRLVQLQNGERIDLEDEEDFNALKESSYSNYFLELDVSFDDTPSKSSISVDGCSEEVPMSKRFAAKRPRTFSHMVPVDPGHMEPSHSRNKSAPPSLAKQKKTPEVRRSKKRNEVPGTPNGKQRNETIPPNPPSTSVPPKKKKGKQEVTGQSSNVDVNGSHLHIVSSPTPRGKGVGDTSKLDKSLAKILADLNSMSRVLPNRSLSPGTPPDDSMMSLPVRTSKKRRVTNRQETSAREPSAQDSKKWRKGPGGSVSGVSGDHIPSEVGAQRDPTPEVDIRNVSTRGTRKSSGKRKRVDLVQHDSTSTKKRKKESSSLGVDTHEPLQTSENTPDDQDSVIVNNLLVGLNAGAIPPSLTPETSPFALSVKVLQKFKRKSGPKTVKAPKSHIDAPSPTTSLNCDVCKISGHTEESCALTGERGPEEPRPHPSELTKKLIDAHGGMENLATANLTAAILKDNGGYPTSAVLPSADDDAAGSYKHQTSEELGTGNLQLSGSPLMTSDGFSSYQFKPPQAHGTHGTSAASSGVDRADEVTGGGDDMQTSKMPNAHDIPQHGAAATKPRISPERMTARVLVPESESSQEDEIHVGRHNASQSSQRRTRTSALLKQLPESRVMGYTTDPAFSEAVHDANLIENCTPAEVEVAAGDSDTGEPERGSDLSVELPSGTAESPRAAEEVSHAQSQSPLPLSNLKSFASPRQSNAPAKSRDSGTLLAHNSQSLPQSLGGHNSKVILSHSRRVEPISEDQFAEMENLPAIDEARDLQHRQITSSKTPLPDCQAPPTPASQNRAAGNSLTRAITSASGSTQTALRVRGLKTVRRAKSDTVSSTPKVGRRIPRATVPSPEGGDLQASGSQNRADSAASKAHKPEHHASPTKAASIENFDHDQDGASSDEPRRSQRKVGASSDRRARLSNGTNVDDVSLLVNRSSPSPVEDLVDASFLDSPNSSQAMDKRKTPLFVSSPPSTQHPAIPSTQDHLPPRMRPGRASQLPPSSRWPSLMSLTTDQVRSAVQHRWNASLGGSSQMNSQNAINNDDANADKSDELDESDGDREKIPT